MKQRLPKTTFPFIWHFLCAYPIRVTIYSLLAIAAGFWGPFNSLIIKHLINVLPNVQNGDMSLLITPGILLVLNFIAFDNFTWRGVTYIRYKTVPVILNRIIGQTMDECLSHSHQFYQDNLSGKIAKQITTLVDGVDKLLSTVAASFLRATSLLLTAFITAYFVNPMFCLLMIVWFIFFTGISIWMSKKLVSLSDKQAAAESVVVGELVDSLSNHSNVRIFARRNYEQQRMSPHFNLQQSTYENSYRYAMIMHSVQGGLIAVMMACAMYLLIHLYSQHLVTIGDFALILGLSMETGHMMWFTMSEVDEFNKAVGRCKQGLNSLLVEQQIEDQPNAKELQCEQGHITFDNVKFNYHGSETLFENKSIQIPAGQKVGLVGFSGGGKTTFVNLILRLYDVTDGKILIDGQDIREVSQASLRENIAMIPQDPSLFQRSLLENIRYGRIDASDEQVILAAKKAHAHEFISQLREGYQALVGERGVKLSGGQRQRIAIARAILKNAPILILDEATSQLDSVTERDIQESLWELMQYKTTIVIAHRLSTLLNMDRILVFNQGKIVADGTHNELLSQNGLYKKLWDAQVGGFLPE